ncbi:hypothetical protein KQX54_018382 [Cotesia glomerata]|uniref:Uncharacterized protein n=1 Tax=Cotesia glomerata TaxID=32391 RepID=A0AAV7IP20_COTGL|nr:hypothetical protein KQX54_018382 [Cotesia glomerata]
MVVDEMDAATTVEEVRESLGQPLGERASRVKINITKPNKWRSVRAFVEVGFSDASTLAALGKVKVGWLVCRIRRWERLDRCLVIRPAHFTVC